MVCAREILLATVSCAALAACGSVGRLDPDPAHGIDLSGSWTLNPAASDDPKPAIEKLRPKPVSHRWDTSSDDDLGDENEPPGSGGQQGGDPRGGGRSRRGGSQGQPQVVYRNNNEAYTRSTVMRMLMADLARAQSVTIRQSASRFSLDYGSAIRTFTPGAVSVVSAAWGVADQSSGWKGKEFVIRVKPQMGVATVEAFSLSDDGRHLVEQLRMGGGEFPYVKLKRVYDQSDKPVQRAAPTND